jgi:ankyrin repeat protein
VSDRDGWTALMAAAAQGDLGLVQLLLSHGAEVNTKTTFGLTALMSAAAKGQAAIAQVLLVHGADLNAKDDNNWTAFVWAADEQHTEVMSLLKQARENQ